MTGPEHYAEAERQIDCAIAEVTHQHPEIAARALQYAQVHATLALAAAAALNDPDEGLPVWDHDEWHRLAGTRPPQADEVTPGTGPT